MEKRNVQMTAIIIMAVGVQVILTKKIVNELKHITIQHEIVFNPTVFKGYKN